MMKNEFMVEELMLAREGVTRVGNNKYVITMAKAVDFGIEDGIIVTSNYTNADNNDIIPDLDNFDEEIQVEYDFSNLGYLTSSYGTTFIFVDKDTLELKAFTRYEPDKIVDLHWSFSDDELEDVLPIPCEFMLYESLALKVQEILTYEYGCRESMVQVVESYYTRDEVLDMFSEIINHS